MSEEEHHASLIDQGPVTQYYRCKILARIACVWENRGQPDAFRGRWCRFHGVSSDNYLLEVQSIEMVKVLATGNIFVQYDWAPFGSSGQILSSCQRSRFLLIEHRALSCWTNKRCVILGQINHDVYPVDFFCTRDKLVTAVLQHPTILYSID